MQRNKTFKGMQNENAVLKQEYESLMKDFVEVCKSEREANKLIQMLVSEFLMPEIRKTKKLQSDESRTVTDEVLQSDESRTVTESGSFWQEKYKKACDQITKLLKHEGFAMGDLNAEIEFRQKAQAENRDLKVKIDVLEEDLETAKSQSEMHANNANNYCGRYIEATAKIKELETKNESKGIFLVHECEGNKGTSRQIAYYAKESDADEFAKDMSLKKENDEKTYKVFKQVSVFAKPIK